MKKIVSMLLLICGVASAADITGAGATFPYPIYAKWAEAYKAETGIGLNYQSIGSGGGIKQIKAKTVDFGASDMPLKQEELDKEGLVQFPAIIGGVVPVVNLVGIQPGQIKLTSEVIAAIYLGKITKWTDSRIKELNPDVKFPDMDITVLHRADGSGTTFLFTEWLSRTVPEWKDKVGSSTSVKWPVGVGGKGNEGVAANAQRLQGAIGYVEYAYAKKNKLAHVQIKNRDGKFVQPDDETFKAAAANADWKTMDVILVNQIGQNAWPITGISYIIMHRQQADSVVGRAVLKFFSWCFNNGEKMAAELDYVPLPKNVVTKVKAEWSKFNLGEIK
ncbi:PstS ABC-type phosphate transport system, periplasmic component [uncultured Caudovirales phage]|uniref:PstS ABC-type phosphate transport system, periplasmic component n=1 Tax=uncultured Caudovirales phage TaxID=2100421 RepID=A0A6J5LKC6_9CAUD|nr:PstS ABC-type phosphate transport system, periplasmic component [uncultured Caudovirales phage]